ncbi:MAG: hypothetical protein D6775_05920 [Caldilineae bacterium]|nr:MAG: hypothetical protein D6775_05920 [Caldilineae bacterium]
MGWVALAQQVDKSAAVDPGFAGEPLLVSAAPQQAAPTQPAATSIELAPIPTVVPPPGGDVAQLTLDPIPETVVLQPIPAVSRPVISRPVVRSRSSR